MHNKNKNYHILTRDERLFYERMAIEGTQQIIEECWKIVNQKNPEEQEEGYRIAALHVTLEGNVQLANMLRSMKQQYGSVEEALTKSGYDHDYD